MQQDEGFFDVCKEFCFYQPCGKCMGYETRACNQRYVFKGRHFVPCHSNYRGKCRAKGGFGAGYCAADLAGNMQKMLEYCKDVTTDIDHFQQKCNHACEDEGVNVCRWCGKHNGEWMRCCSIRVKYDPTHPCHEVNFGPYPVGARPILPCHGENERERRICGIRAANKYAGQCVATKTTATWKIPGYTLQANMIPWTGNQIGSDIPKTTASACAKDCNELQTQCVAFTFFRHTDKCRLHSALGDQKFSDDKDTYVKE